MATFNNSLELKKVTFGSQVNTIGNNAFLDCPNLGAVYFKEDAPGIVLADDHSGDPSFPSDATFYYLSGKSGWEALENAGYKIAVYNPHAGGGGYSSGTVATPDTKIDPADAQNNLFGTANAIDTTFFHLKTIEV